MHTFFDPAGRMQTVLFPSAGRSIQPKMRVLALLVALLMALAPFADAKLSFKHFKFRPHRKPKNDGFKRSSKTFVSKASCKAVAKSYNFSASKSAHAKAGAHCCAIVPAHAS